MSVVVDVAEAVTQELNAATLGQEIEAKRHYVPVFDLPEMNQLHVSVAPNGITVSKADRARNTHDVKIDVAVQKKFETGDSAELDPLMNLVEEIADFFRLRRLSSYPNAHWVKTENDPVYAQEHFDQLRQFTSVLTFTFRVVR